MKRPSGFNEMENTTQVTVMSLAVCLNFVTDILYCP